MSVHQAELDALRENLVRYEIAAASERQMRDRLIVTWRDILQEWLAAVTTDYRLIHHVIGSMDEFLKRSKK